MLFLKADASYQKSVILQNKFACNICLYSIMINTNSTVNKKQPVGQNTGAKNKLVYVKSLKIVNKIKQQGLTLSKHIT